MIWRSFGVRLAERSSACSMTQDDPYRPGIPSFLPLRSAGFVIPESAFANTIDGNVPYIVAT
ncbi:hypothetical protein D3C83_179020 [compost metagenome]